METLTSEEIRELLDCPRGATERINDAVRHIVLRRPSDYPTLSRLEMRKNAFRFQNGSGRVTPVQR